ncbi:MULTISPECIES: hypothetical protein [unclassified Streptomyces]|uniref:hypothetical protein n=1 Tax=unclassified Streptomyces TaxID=2593676 RepID=UPI0036F50F9A
MEHPAYTLEPFKDAAYTSWRGRLGDFGYTTVQRRNGTPGAHRGFAELFGERLPQAEFSGLGSGFPSLVEGRLSIDGEEVTLRRNARAFRKNARALKLEHRGRTRSYTSLGLGKGARLAHDGVEITVVPGSPEAPRDRSRRTVTVSGPADAADLALALLFEAVDTSALTLGGTLATTPFTLVRPHPRNGGYE